MDFIKEIKELYRFLSERGISVQEDETKNEDEMDEADKLLAQYHSSKDIVEETLLRLAAVKTKPTKCYTNYKDNTCILDIYGLNEADIKAFTNYLGLPPDGVIRAEAKTSFLIPGDAMCEDFLPRIKAQIIRDFEKNPQLIKPYICIPVAMGRVSRIILGLTEMDNKDEKLTKFQDNMLNFVMLLMGGDKYFSKIYFEAMEEYQQDLQDILKNSEKMDKEFKGALTDLAVHMRALTIGMTPDAVLNHQVKLPKPVPGQRFFDRSPVENVTRAGMIPDDKSNKPIPASPRMS